MIRRPQATLEPGDLFEVDAEPAAAGRGVLAIDDCLARALDARAGVTLRDESGRAAELAYDEAAGVLRGPAAAAVLGGRSGAVRLRLEAPGRWAVVPERAPTAAAAGTTFPLADASPLLRAVREGRLDGRERVELAREAFRLSLVPGFDRLLALDVARGVTPYEHQVRAAKAALGQFRGRVLLCDEVGLGKTIEAGLVTLELVARGLARRVLVLTPPSLVAQWRAEMREKFLLDLATPDDAGFREGGGLAGHDRLLVSLDTAKREPHASALAARPWDLVVVDEAHHLRNRRTVAWRFVASLRKKYVLMLTATPVQNGLEDLYNLITLLRPGQLHTPKGFRREHVSAKDPLAPRDPARLRALVGEVMVRNRRATCGLRFTRRVATTVRVEPTPEEAALYRDVTALVRSLHANGAATAMTLQTLQMEAGSSAASAAGTLERIPGAEALAVRAREAGAGAKEEWLARRLGAGHEKTIVFTRFRATQARLEAALRGCGVECASLHGDLRHAEKERQVERFRGPARVLLSTDVGSEGRNLQFCADVVNYDLPWNPMVIEQRIGRVSRVGQDQEVRVANLVAAGTIEERILGVLDRKINLFELVVGEVDMILGNLDDDRAFDAIALEAWAGASSDEDAARRIDELGDRLARAKEEYVRVRRLEDEVLGS